MDYKDIKMHHMISKSVKNYILNNKLSKTYLKKVEKLKTLQDYIDFYEKVEDDGLKEFLNSKISSKLSNVETEEENHYLDFDSGVFLNLNNKLEINKILKVKDKKCDDILKLLENKEKNLNKIISEIDGLRQKNSYKINILYYCLDSIYNYISIAINSIRFLSKDQAKRAEFLEVSKLLNAYLDYTLLDYYIISIKEENLSENAINYLKTESKKNGIKKNLFVYYKINTNLDMLNKIKDIIKYLYTGNENEYIDIYSCKKILELYAIFSK